MEVAQFRAMRGVGDNDILMFNPAGGPADIGVVYTISRGSLHPDVDVEDMVPGEPEGDGLSYRARIPTPRLPLPIKFVFDEGIDGTLTILIEDLDRGITYHSLMVRITPEARRQFEHYTRNGAPAPALPVRPVRNEAALPRVKIPRGQEDAISFAEIPDGTIMADFQNERDTYHRYYTREMFIRGVGPRMRNPFTNRPINGIEVQFYIAELDESMPPFPAHGAGRRKGRKTHRKRRFHTRRA